MPGDHTEGHHPHSHDISQTPERDDHELLEEFRELIPLGNIFVGHFGYHLEVDPKADTFYFDAKNKTIYLSPDLVERKGLNHEERINAFLHELSHLVQLFQDPVAYLKTFDTSKEKAQAQKNPEAREYVKEAWRSFYNVTNDLHGNSLIPDRVPRFQTTAGAEIPVKMYRKLVPKEDLRGSTYVDQFLFSILRNVMDPDAQMQVDPEVEKRLMRPLSYLGKNYGTLIEAAKDLLFDAETKYGKIAFRTNQFFAPIFEELVAADLNNGKKGKPKISTVLHGLDAHFSEDDLRKILQAHQEANASTQEKSANAMEKYLKNFADKSGFSDLERQQMQEIMGKVDQLYRDIMSLWKNFLEVSMELAVKEIAPYSSGAHVSVPDFVRQLPILLSDPGQARFFERRFLEAEKETIKPRKITLFFIVDLSGSMDRQKRQSVQEVVYAVTKSLIQFRRKYEDAIETPPDGEELPLDININIIGFGSTTEVLLPHSLREEEERRIDDSNREELDRRLWKSIFSMKKDFGGTVDAPALEIVKNDVTQKKIQEQLQNGEEVVIVFEITDGETTSADDSKKIVHELNAKEGIYCRGIQIPGTVYSEGTPVYDPSGHPVPPEVLAPTGTFSEVWGKYGRKLDALYVLKQVLFELLHDVISKRIEKGL